MNPSEDGSSAKSSPNGSWWGRSPQPVAHPSLVSLQERKGKSSPLGVAWGIPADFEVPTENPSPPPAPSSKDKSSHGGLSLRAFSSTSLPLTPQSSSCFSLGGYWFGHGMKSNQRQRITFQIYQGESPSPGELWQKKRQERGTKEMILALFYSWRPEAESWDPRSSDLCKTMGSPSPMGGYEPDPSAESCCHVSITQLHLRSSETFLSGRKMIIYVQRWEVSQLSAFLAAITAWETSVCEKGRIKRWIVGHSAKNKLAGFLLRQSVAAQIHTLTHKTKCQQIIFPSKEDDLLISITLSWIRKIHQFFLSL